MASKAYPNVYLESMEATGDPGNESNQVRNQTVQGTPVGQCEQRILGSRRKRYNAASGTHMQPSQSRLSLPNGLLCSIAQNVRNRRMPNGTYGGVRGRETKEIGGKLQESFVFLLLDYAHPDRDEALFSSVWKQIWQLGIILPRFLPRANHLNRFVVVSA